MMLVNLLRVILAVSFNKKAQFWGTFVVMHSLKSSNHLWTNVVFTSTFKQLLLSMTKHEFCLIPMHKRSDTYFKHLCICPCWIFSTAAVEIWDAESRVKQKGYSSKGYQNTMWQRKCNSRYLSSMIYKPDVYGAQKAELKRSVLCIGRSDTSRFCRQQRSGQQVSYLI